MPRVHAVEPASRDQEAGRRRRDAQDVVDFGPGRARDRPALDRPGHRRSRLAAVELHDQPDPVGRLWRRAVGGRPDPDLAEPAAMTTALFDLRGKAAIVTGGNGGIGLGIARGLADAGANIAVAGRNTDKTRAATDQLTSLGVRSVGLQADVTDP